MQEFWLPIQESRRLALYPGELAYMLLHFQEKKDFTKAVSYITKLDVY